MSDKEYLASETKKSECIARAEIIASRFDCYSKGERISKEKYIDLCINYRHKRMRIYRELGLISDALKPNKKVQDELDKTEIGIKFKDTTTPIATVTLKVSSILKGDRLIEGKYITVCSHSGYDPCPHFNVPMHPGKTLTIFLKSGWDSGLILNPNLYLVSDSKLTIPAEQDAAPNR